MAKRERTVHDPKLSCDLGCPPMEAERRPPSGFANHLDLQPVHASADPGAERLGSGLLGSKPRSKALGRIPLPQAIGLLCSSEDAIQEPLSVALHRLLNAPDLYHVDTAADDHEYQAKAKSPLLYFLNVILAAGCRWREASIISDLGKPAAIPRALQIGAISRDEPSRVIKSVSGAVLGCVAGFSAAVSAMRA